MRVQLLSVAALAGACSGQGPRQLEAGEYRLDMSGGNAWASDLRFTVEPDGTFDGYPSVLLGDSPPYACHAVLDADEHADLTDAVNDAWLIGRWDDFSDTCADGSTYHVMIEARLDGETLRNAFTYAECAEPQPSLRAFRERVNALLAAHASRGDCTGCPVDLDGTCYRNPTAPGDLCVNLLHIACDEETAGVVVTCALDGPLECDPSSGWVPAPGRAPH